MKRLAVVVGVAATLLLAPALAASAHPLGNFTINTYAGIRVQPGHVLVHYVVDMAEIPTFQERARIDADGDGKLSDAELTEWASRTCHTVTGKLAASSDGRPLLLATTDDSAGLRPGAAGLQTLRLDCSLSAALAAGSHVIDLRDANYLGRVGWHEITAIGDHATLVSSSVPRVSVSRELTAYPQDLLQSPLDVREAVVRARPGGSAAADEGTIGSGVLPRGVDAATRAFTGFLARAKVGVAFSIVAGLLAIVLGAVHALAPGHGKTVMAAYLVGQRGSFRQGAVIAATVTATHTTGVLVLGIVLSASTSLASERIYPVLGAVSGVMLAAIGLSFLRRALRARAHGHHHLGGDDAQPLGMKAVAGMGFAGGLVPSPSAVVVLLGASALHRVWLGIVLVVAYGLGMALTLSGAGLVLVRARAWLERRSHRDGSELLMRFARAVPIVTASIIMTVGTVLAARGATRI